VKYFHRRSLDGSTLYIRDATFVPNNIHSSANYDKVKNAVFFWDITLCGSCKNRRFGGTYHLYRQGEKNQRAMNNFGSYKSHKE
jgi:hypothetical protein